MSVDRQFFVKICGLRDADSAQAAVDAGADALGFILAPSQRQVGLRDVSDVVSALDRSSSHPSIVGITVNPTPGELRAIEANGVVEAIQLSGDEDPDLLVTTSLSLIKAFRFPGGTGLDEAMRRIDPWFTADKPVSRVIIEGHAAGSYGGTGAMADRELVHQLAVRYPVVLAGGLTPGNVEEAIRDVRPWGVDVSSGVETDGKKDIEKIRDFVQRSRAAYADLT